MTILDDIVAATRARVAREKESEQREELVAGKSPEGPVSPGPAPGASGRVVADVVGDKPDFPTRRTFPFEAALRDQGVSFICEVKKASPSKGLIAESFPYLDIARDYQAGGAAAISVLTEPEFFRGDNAYLREIRGNVTIPLLRKDFVIDPFQIGQAKRLGADAILLICAILTPADLAASIAMADSLGLSCLVEAHDENEVRVALDAGARVVGVNNRDLRTFTVDTSISLRLRSVVPPDVLFVSESGIRTPDDIARLRDGGVDAVLVGETLMRAPDRRAALAELTMAGGLPA